MLKRKVTKVLPLIYNEFAVARDNHCTVDLIYRLPKIKNRVTLGATAYARGQLYCWINAYQFPSLKQVAETLAHEFTHIEQYADGRLVDVKFNRQLMYWTGILMGCYGVEGDFAKYEDSPWEVEARARATKFVEKYYG
jgi:hypothetical protein